MKAAVLAWALSAAAQESPAERLQKRVEECARHVTERFVFFGGGSGALISADGYCLTNHHVAGELPRTRVTLHSGRQYFARRICTDERGDLALFKIEGEEGESFPYLEFGDSDRLEVGQYVLACGNPFGITLPAEDRKMYPTVTLGIVSALHRRQGDYFDCIQTDAAVNPGNSGGPLVTLDGRLVGINGRIATRYLNRVNSGVGYAISSAQIRNFLPEMMKGGEDGRVHHGQVTGLVLAPEGAGGARVARVVPGTTAERAGFEKDDLIVGVNGYAIPSAARFLGVLGTYPMGHEVAVRVRRGAQEREVRVRLDRYQPEGLALPFPLVPRPPERPRGSGYLGVYVEEEGGEVVVRDVRPGSPADQAGLREGDAILRVEGRRVTRRDELNAQIWRRAPGTVVRLAVRRGGREEEVAVRLGRHPEEE
jgi:S1-C subfamily serine protease